MPETEFVNSLGRGSDDVTEGRSGIEIFYFARQKLLTANSMIFFSFFFLWLPLGIWSSLARDQT